MEKSQDGQVLIRKLIQSAHKRLKVAKAALDLNDPEDSISRSYYAFLDIATAVLMTKDLRPKSHSGAIALFGQHLVKTGEIEEKYGRWFNRIEKSRLEADYAYERELSLEEAKEALKMAKEFVREMEKYLQSKQFAK